MSDHPLTLAVKIAPEVELLEAASRAGLQAVELFLSCGMLEDRRGIVKRCRSYPFRYAIHSPNDGYEPMNLAEIVDALNPEVIVFHNVYWEDEWDEIFRIFSEMKKRVCIENIFSDNEPLKFMRRYGCGKCADIEHLQLQCAGLYEEALRLAVRDAIHIHLTGYFFGSDRWHSHIHHSPEHNRRILDAIMETGYSGLVVSEARAALQTHDEFCRLRYFFTEWQKIHRDAR